MVTYERNRALRHKYTVKFEKTKKIDLAQERGFPDCKGLYPDCPEKPDKKHPMCRSCPVVEKAESSKF